MLSLLYDIIVNKMSPTLNVANVNTYACLLLFYISIKDLIFIDEISSCLIKSRKPLAHLNHYLMHCYLIHGEVNSNRIHRHR